MIPRRNTAKQRSKEEGNRKHFAFSVQYWDTLSSFSRIYLYELQNSQFPILVKYRNEVNLRGKESTESIVPPA
jgi:hypothetical protein